MHMYIFKKDIVTMYVTHLTLDINWNVDKHTIEKKYFYL